jgi:hypothetical protein
LITYKKDPKANQETFLDSLYEVFCGLPEDRRTSFLALYDPGEDLGQQDLRGKVGRICNVNEVGGRDLQNSVFARYSRLNHSCSRNAVGQVSESGEHQVRAVRKVGKGEEVAVTYLEGRLGTREERQAMFQRKWGFRCACSVCEMPGEESTANDATIRYVRETQAAIGRQDWAQARSQLKALQELHRLLAACYRLEEQDESVLRCVLLALITGMRKAATKGKVEVAVCPGEVRPALEERLGPAFWADTASYEREAMRVATVSGHAKKMVEYMT